MEKQDGVLERVFWVQQVQHFQASKFRVGQLVCYPYGAADCPMTVVALDHEKNLVQTTWLNDEGVQLEWLPCFFVLQYKWLGLIKSWDNRFHFSLH